MPLPLLLSLVACTGASGQEIRRFTSSVSVGAVAFNPGNTSEFTTVMSNADAVVWNKVTGGCVNWSRSLYVSQLWLYGMAYNPVNPVEVASGGNDRLVKIWNKDTGTLLQTLSGHTHVVKSISFNPSDPNELVSAAADNITRLWNRAANTSVLLRHNHTYSVMAASFNPLNTSEIITSSGDGSVVIFHRSGAVVRKYQFQLLMAWHAAFNPFDDREFIVALNDGRAVIVDRASGTTVRTFFHPDVVRFAAFNPCNASEIATATDGGNQVVLWHRETGQVLHNFSGHSGLIPEIAFNPGNCSELISVGEDSLIILWKGTSVGSSIPSPPPPSSAQPPSAPPSSPRQSTRNKVTTIVVATAGGAAAAGILALGLVVKYGTGLGISALSSATRRQQLAQVAAESEKRGFDAIKSALPETVTVEEGMGESDAEANNEPQETEADLEEETAEEFSATED